MPVPLFDEFIFILLYDCYNFFKFGGIQIIKILKNIFD